MWPFGRAGALPTLDLTSLPQSQTLSCFQALTVFTSFRSCSTGKFEIPSQSTMAFWNPIQLKGIFGYLRQGSNAKEIDLGTDSNGKSQVVERAMVSSALRIVANALSRANSQVTEEISVGDVLERLELSDNLSEPVGLFTRPRVLTRQETTNSIEDEDISTSVGSSLASSPDSSATNLEGVQDIIPVDEETNLPIIYLCEVREHDSMDDGWMILYDKVYDVTNFINEHPGGAFVMMEYLGRDATSAFAGHSRDAVEMLDDLVLGILPKTERSNVYSKPTFV
eukprot:maker-scaffold488_size158317-snap-gene-0.23 protein:Tk09351 transcript:maker-scaffold488_size158317-snap-gene-0.23-mRNA-1 annotation:"cytochrome b5-like"